MRCPRCDAEMSETSYGGVQLDLCSSCPGVWFDWGELEAFNRSQSNGAIRGVPGPGAVFEPTGDSAHVRCPRCERDILRTGTVGRRQVVRCTSCGGLYLPLAAPSSDNDRRGRILQEAMQGLCDLVSGFFGRGGR